ncbi:MAG TPA: cytochrome P460 family protein [Steroidobacteraceae bacterium]|jgi:cytochrome c553
MKARTLLVATLLFPALAPGADLEAGKARATAVCAACHGADGISVAANIPNLAGQKADYLAGQLQAFRKGGRKNDLMNAIASQLGDADIADVAAYFAGLPGAPQSAAKSELLPNVARSRVGFPAGYPSGFTRYMTMDVPDNKQVRHFYANSPAIEAARAGTGLPDGSMIIIEVFNARLDGQENPVKGGDGYFAPGERVAYVAMERQLGWGAAIPDMLRNGDWNYAPFTTDKVQRAGFNQATCFACHKPKAEDSYLFTLPQLREAAAKN